MIFSGSWWLLIFLQIFFQLINIIGIYGRGVKKRKIEVAGFYLGIGTVISQWVINGFIAFLISIILWLLFSFILTIIVIKLLSNLGIVSKDFVIAMDIADSKHKIEIQSVKDLLMRPNKREVEIPEILQIIKSNNFQSVFNKWGINDNEAEEIINRIYDEHPYLRKRSVLRLLMRDDVLSTYVEWKKILSTIEQFEIEKKKIPIELEQKAENAYINFRYALHGFDVSE